MGNFIYGEWETLDSSWDPENQKNIYSITSEYTGFIMAGTAKLDHITVKKKLGIFKTEKTKYSIDKIKKVHLIDEEKVKGKSFVKKGIAGGLGYMFFGNVGLAAGALAAGNDVLKQKSGTIGIEFKDKNWIVTKFDLRNSDSKDFFKLLLELIKTKHPPKKKDKAPF
jgi:hypothetical protein